MFEPVLLTKLYVPPPRSRIVLRPRLIERLNEGLQRTSGVTLISASAGFETFLRQVAIACQSGASGGP